MNKFIEENASKMLQDLIDWVNIPSVLQESCPGAPFGEGIGMALDFMEKLAQSMGFTTKNYDGYALEITAGTGDFLIGILGHADVVPASEDWDTNPFAAEVIDGKLVGRGVMDDKGPMMSCLYAMKYLQDYQLIPQDKQIRMIVGTDEEELWRGITYYKEHADRLPQVGFTPDGDFPVIYAEKGLLDFDLCYPVTVMPTKYRLEYLTGGQSRNSVPSHVSFVVTGETILEAHTEEQIDKWIKEFIGDVEGVEVQVEPLKLTCTVKGVTVHAMHPEKGENAFAKAMHLLGKFGTALDVHEFVTLYNTYLSNDYHGKKLGLCCKDEMSGPLTFNDGGISYRDQKMYLECNLRYPVTVEFEELDGKIQDTFHSLGLEHTQVDHLLPVYSETDSTLIKTLMTAYQEVTGDMSEPLTTSGASYARAMDNIVCFGPLYPDQEDVAHQANEYMEIAKYKEMTTIYIKALLGLMK